MNNPENSLVSSEWWWRWWKYNNNADVRCLPDEYDNNANEYVNDADEYGNEVNKFDNEVKKYDNDWDKDDEAQLPRWLRSHLLEQQDQRPLESHRIGLLCSIM